MPSGTDLRPCRHSKTYSWRLPDEVCRKTWKVTTKETADDYPYCNLPVVAPGKGVVRAGRTQYQSVEALLGLGGCVPGLHDCPVDGDRLHRSGSGAAHRAALRHSIHG